MLQLTPTQQNQQYTQPPSQKSLLPFITALGYDDQDNPLKTISQVIVARLHQPWRTILNILNKGLTGKDSGLDKKRPSMLQIPDTMLNDTIREMNAYKEYVVKWVRQTRGKGPMIRGEEVSEHVESFKTKIVLSTKKKLASKAKKVKETYGDDPDQMHAATLL
ncbi:hypothetical protein Tco_1518869, partial [Tanacetum coccineum]